MCPPGVFYFFTFAFNCLLLLLDVERRLRILYVCDPKAFHATPNVYKRKSKEIHMETEPCGVNCFLLQVCSQSFIHLNDSCTAL